MVVNEDNNEKRFTEFTTVNLYSTYPILLVKNNKTKKRKYLNLKLEKQNTKLPINSLL